MHQKPTRINPRNCWLCMWRRCWWYSHCERSSSYQVWNTIISSSSSEPSKSCFISISWVQKIFFLKEKLSGLTTQIKTIILWTIFQKFVKLLKTKQRIIRTILQKSLHSNKVSKNLIKQIFVCENQHLRVRIDCINFEQFYGFPIFTAQLLDRF